MMTSLANGVRRRLGRLAAVLSMAAALALATTLCAGAEGTAPATFASPRQAAAALVKALRGDEVGELLRIFGPDGDKLVRSGDPIADKKARANFVSAYDQSHKISLEDKIQAVLVIGKHAWPFPIPVVSQAGAWHFDVDAGEQEILDRRIGRNELSAIDVCRAYVDAQREYASQDRNGDGLLEYASRFRSMPGRQDGLYWPAGAGEQASPLGPLMVSAQAEGYGQKMPPGHKREPYHGYYYRILTRQGPAAPAGAYDYMVRGKLIGGFALVAFPAKYGASGVMTFVVNQDGVVYQQDLGPKTTTIARAMVEYNPGKGWTTVPANTGR